MSLSAEHINKIVKQAGKVAVLFGGLSAEREVSLKSGAAVLKALQAAGVDAVGVDADENLLSELNTLNPDCVFIVLHGKGGEDGSLQGALEIAGYRYTGSKVLASALGMDKQQSKHIWQSMNLPVAVAKTLQFDTDFSQTIEELGGKAVVKPVHEGSSIGMSIVDSAAGLKLGYDSAAKFDRAVMAERYINGPEFTVAILGDEVLPVIKLETDNEFYDYQAKYESNETRYLCPCGLTEEKEQEVKDLAWKAFSALGCSGWGRVDVMANNKGEFFILEVNTVPGMTDHSLVPMAANAHGYDFEALVLLILQDAIEKVDQ